MSESPFTSCSAELAEILARLVRARYRLKAAMPATMAKLKAGLNGYPIERAADIELLHNIGLTLSHQQEPITMGELSRALDVPVSSATRIVDWLVKDGYAERQSDPDDRRIVRVTLTEAGLETYRTISAFVRGRVQQWLSHFTPEECIQLVYLLRKLLDAWEEEGQELKSQA